MLITLQVLSLEGREATVSLLNVEELGGGIHVGLLVAFQYEYTLCCPNPQNF